MASAALIREALLNLLARSGIFSEAEKQIPGIARKPLGRTTIINTITGEAEPIGPGPALVTERGTGVVESPFENTFRSKKTLADIEDEIDRLLREKNLPIEEANREAERIIQERFDAVARKNLPKTVQEREKRLRGITAAAKRGQQKYIPRGNPENFDPSPSNIFQNSEPEPINQEPFYVGGQSPESARIEKFKLVPSKSKEVKKTVIPERPRKKEVPRGKSLDDALSIESDPSLAINDPNIDFLGENTEQLLERVRTVLKAIPKGQGRGTAPVIRRVVKDISEANEADRLSGQVFGPTERIGEVLQQKPATHKGFSFQDLTEALGPKGEQLINDTLKASGGKIFNVLPKEKGTQLKQLLAARERLAKSRARAAREVGASGRQTKYQPLRLPTRPNSELVETIRQRLIAPLKGQEFPQPKTRKPTKAQSEAAAIERELELTSGRSRPEDPTPTLLSGRGIKELSRRRIIDAQQGPQKIPTTPIGLNGQPIPTPDTVRTIQRSTIDPSMRHLLEAFEEAITSGQSQESVLLEALKHILATPHKKVRP